MKTNEPDLRSSSDLSGGVMPAALTDIGCEREINEDRYASFRVNGTSIWVVCDGMGGAVGGELAAQLAVETIKKLVDSKSSVSAGDIANAIQEANRIIVLRRQNPAFSGMGTTIVSAVVSREELHVLHAGDSRAYVIGPDGIKQLTLDHTYVQDLVNRGMITKEEALYHPQSHVLTRCLGGDLKISLDSTSFGINPGIPGQYKLILCSDGLYSLITDEELYDIAYNEPPQEACITAVELARDRGGFDNITLAVIPLAGELIDYDPNQSFSNNTRKLPAIESRTREKKSKKSLTQGQKLIIVAMLALMSLIFIAVFFLVIFS